MRPVQRFNEFLIELTNQFETCKTTDFAKQLGVRTSSWAGGIDLMVTIGMGIVMKFVPGTDATSQELYNSLYGFAMDKSCAGTARSLGRSLSISFNTKVPDEYFAEQLTFSNKPEV